MHGFKHKHPLCFLFIFIFFLRKLIDRQLYLIITSPLISPLFLAVTMSYKAIVDLFIYLFILHLECFGPMATQYLIFSSSVSV